MTPPPSAELKALSRADNVVRVRGGAAQVFALAKGDRLRAIDLEGGQGALFYAFSADGRDGAALLGLEAGHAGTLPDLIAANENAEAVRHRLAGHDLAKASGVALSGPQ